MKRFAAIRRIVSLTAYLLPLAALLLPAGASAQSQAARRFDDYARLLSPEKVYLHTDREIYNIGDTIWFRGYLENVADQAEYPECNYLYVELFSKKWELNLQNTRSEELRMRTRVKVKRNENGEFTGYLPLTEDLNSGLATLRAYSYWMLNGAPEYLFTKNIELRNAPKDAFAADLVLAEYTEQRTYDDLGIRNPFRKEMRRSSRRESDIDLQFLPESGRYLPGRRSVMGVKALGSDGLGVKVRGTVKAATGEQIASFETNELGMGKFFLTVPAGTKKLSVETETDGEGFRFHSDIPLPEAKAVVIHAEPDEKGISVTVAESGLSLPDSTFLVVYDRSGIVLSSTFAQSRRGKRIEYSDLKPGINNLAVIDNAGNVYAERPFFVFPTGTLRSTVTLDKSHYGSREPAEATIRLTDAAGRPVSGNFSLAVTDEGYAPESGEAPTIESWLLLGSELKGWVEQPRRYFDASRSLRQRREEVDVLLLTQGWKYYDLERILQQRTAQPRFGKEYTQSITGYVNGLLGKSKHATLSFVAPRINYSQIADLDSTAYFSLSNLDFPDGTQFLVGAQGKGKVFQKSYMPILNPEYFAAQIRYPDYLTYRGYDTSYGEYARQSYASTDGSLIYSLAPARIEAPRFRLSPYPDDSFKTSQYRDQKQLARYADLDLLTYIYETCPEVRSNADLRRNQRLRVEPPIGRGYRNMLVYMNGVPVEVIDLMNLHVSDVQAMVYLTGADASKYETALMNSGTGYTLPVILLSVRYPVREATNVTADAPLGWQTPARFYTPKYESAASKRSFEPMRPTLHWEPELVFRNGVARVRFYTSDHASPWRFVLEGVTEDGRPVYSNTLLEDVR